MKCLADADSFHHRSLVDEVVHIDIFHSLADVSHYPIAQASRRAVDEFSQEASGLLCVDCVGRLHRFYGLLQAEAGQRQPQCGRNLPQTAHRDTCISRR